MMQSYTGNDICVGTQEWCWSMKSYYLKSRKIGYYFFINSIFLKCIEIKSNFKIYKACLWCNLWYNYCISNTSFSFNLMKPHCILPSYNYRYIQVLLLSVRLNIGIHFTLLANKLYVTRAATTLNPGEELN